MIDDFDNPYIKFEMVSSEINLLAGKLYENIQNVDTCISLFELLSKTNQTKNTP